MGSETSATAPEGPAPSLVVPLDEPADGVPHVVETERELARAADAVAAGEGPVAIDAERASGYRYGQRAYLVQVRREGAGTWLIDPVGCPDLSPLDSATAWADLALRAAAAVEAEYAGVDLLPASDGTVHVLEVNGIPGWEGLQQATELDVAGAIVDLAVGGVR